MPNNKVKFGLKNVHYAPLTLTGGVPSYDTPIPIPGAVSMSLSVNGEPENFYADDGVYYVINNNMGYEGDLEIALIPESFRTGPLGEALDGNNVLVERSDTQLAPFALLFEFDGDHKHIRHVLYNCTASRPSIEGNTKEETLEVKTETLTIKAAPLPDGKVKVKTGDSTDSTVYEGWYGSVYVASTSANVAKLSALSITGVTLTPAFDANITNYTAATTDATNVVTATAADSASVTLLVNGSSHTSGEAATWNTGTNTVVAIVSKSGYVSRTYTVTVTKSAS